MATPASFSTGYAPPGCLVDYARHDQPMIRETIVQQLNHWKEDIDLAGIRDQSSLAKLPEAGPKALRKFWADVDQLLKTAKEAKK